MALKYRDLEWAKELSNLENQPEPAVKEEVNKGEEPQNISQTVFNKESTALENIVYQYAIKEKNGIRSFNINSEFDRNEAELVIIEKPFYARGETVKYYVPSKDELSFMRGTVNGFVMGYREAFRDVNVQYSTMLSMLKDDVDKPEEKGPKPKKGSQGGPRKKKENAGGENKE